jgi:hypothetical protein
MLLLAVGVGSQSELVVGRRRRMWWKQEWEKPNSRKKTSLWFFTSQNVLAITTIRWTSSPMEEYHPATADLHLDGCSPGRTD